MAKFRGFTFDFVNDSLGKEPVYPQILVKIDNATVLAKTLLPDEDAEAQGFDVLELMESLKRATLIKKWRHEWTPYRANVIYGELDLISSSDNWRETSIKELAGG